MSESESSACGSCSQSSCSAHASNRGTNESDEQFQQKQLMESRLCQIKHKIVVISGKGGVGKSSTAVNLAMSLNKAGFSVGLMDVDIHGPSIPKMFGTENERPMATDNGMSPINILGIRTISIGYMLESQTDALIMRGPLKNGVIQQFIRDVDWGPLDFLIVDCPPGTGDEPLSIAQMMGDGTHAVIVTTPQDVAIFDVQKSVTFCQKVNMNILGIIENMSGLKCPHCNEIIELFKVGGGEKLAEKMDVNFLGRVPIDPEMVQAGDKGEPYLAYHDDTLTAQALNAISQNVVAQCEAN